ncbi:pentatricopeptide repeat-containing protein At4g21705, mitochondrial-like [Rutidosis leptorrhynchoides]|uniref:pentatricopeptide repeat-containing protein At4g21705, mitochondrial-like n=1 Tax=Rutidosis leptorrhynchoides TaxID=125765 RepID=UPI003A98F816
MLAMAGRLRNLQNVKTLIEIRSYTTATIARNETTTKKKKKESLYSKISPLGNPNLAMTPELDDWIQKGNKYRVSEVKQIIHDLRKRRRFHHALEISEWMNKKGICAFTSTDHAVQLDLIGKVNGFLEAEKYFNSLTDQDKSTKTYGALLHCYVRQRETERSLAHLQKMKEQGFVSSPVTYNDIMCLYTRTNETDKVHNVLKEMKKNGVAPDNLSYRICINSYGDKMNIEGMESILMEMENDPNIIMDWNTYAVVANCYINGKVFEKANNVLKKAEKLVEKDGLGYNHLISLHARLGNKDDVLRLWGVQKTKCNRVINRDYITMVKSLVRLDEFEEAEKLLIEWKSYGNVHDFRVPCFIVDGYLEKGLCDKAKDLLDNLSKDGKATTPDSWANVAVEFLKKGDVGTCVSCMESAFSLPLEKKDWKLESKVVENLLSGVGEKASSVQEVELFVKKLKKVVKFDRKMYHSLMKGYINGGKDVGKVLEDMKADGIEEDVETKKILGLQQNKV